MPFMELVNGNGEYKSDEELATIIKDAGLDLSRPIVGSCGSGTTACVVETAL